MNRVIAQSREEVSVNAPSMATIKISPDKIRDVIGKGGATIRKICDDTGASIDLDDDGTVRIYAEDKAAAKRAIDTVLGITAEAEIGKLYQGKVVRIADFGAFAEIFPGTDGLIHISHLAEGRVDKVTDILSEGDEVMAKCIDIDPAGRIRLSRKEALAQLASEE